MARPDREGRERSRKMLANNFMYYVQRFLPGQYWHWMIIGVAVLGLVGLVWAWLRKKRPD